MRRIGSPALDPVRSTRSVHREALSVIEITADDIVRTHVDLFGRDALVLDVSNNARRAVSWDEVGDVADVEVLTLVHWWEDQAGSDQNRQYICIRGGNEPDGHEMGYQVRIHKDAVGIARYGDGSSVELEGKSFPFHSYVSYWVRFRAEGGDLKARVWPRDGEEPVEWLVEVTDSSPLPAGWVGLGCFTSGSYPYPCLGVGVGGVDAPMGVSSDPGQFWSQFDSLEDWTPRWETTSEDFSLSQDPCRHLNSSLVHMRSHPDGSGGFFVWDGGDGDHLRLYRGRYSDSSGFVFRGDDYLPPGYHSFRCYGMIEVRANPIGSGNRWLSVEVGTGLDSDNGFVARRYSTNLSHVYWRYPTESEGPMPSVNGVSSGERVSIEANLSFDILRDRGAVFALTNNPDAEIDPHTGNYLMMGGRDAADFHYQTSSRESYGIYPYSDPSPNVGLSYAANEDSPVLDVEELVFRVEAEYA